MSRAPKIWIKGEELPQLATGVYDFGRRNFMDDALPLAWPVSILCTSELSLPHSERSVTPFAVEIWVWMKPRGFAINWSELEASLVDFLGISNRRMFCSDLPPTNHDKVGR